MSTSSCPRNIPFSSALGVKGTAGELGATPWPNDSCLGCWEGDPREDTRAPCRAQPMLMRVLGTWHLTSLASSRCKPAEQTWPASHRAHCHICELCLHIGPTSPLTMGKGLPAGTNGCTKRVWSYLWPQNLRGRKDSSSRSSWVNSCVSPHTPWLLSPCISAPDTVGCFTPYAPQLPHFFPEQNTVMICRLVKGVFEFCKNSNVWGFFFLNHTLWKFPLHCLTHNPQQTTTMVHKPSSNCSGEVSPFNFVVCSGLKYVHINE